MGPPPLALTLISSGIIVSFDRGSYYYPLQLSKSLLVDIEERKHYHLNLDPFWNCSELFAQHEPYQPPAEP